MALEKSAVQPVRVAAPAAAERARDAPASSAARERPAEPGNAAMKLSLNGYHGPLRLWAVAAILWIIGAFGYSWYLDHARPVVEEVLVGIATRGDCETRAKQDRRVNVQTCYERIEQRAAWQRTERLIWVFLPPVLLLPFAGGIVWIIRGFRRDRQAVKP